MANRRLGVLGIVFVPVPRKGAYNWFEIVDPLFKLNPSAGIDKKTKRGITSKMKNLLAAVEEVEHLSGMKYPKYYIEPILTVAESGDNIGGLGVLYSRTIPIEVGGRVEILVEISAPLILYATKVTLRLVLAHEFLHYVELIRNFTKMDLVSQITSTSMYEERHTDYSRAIDPAKIFSNKRLVSELRKRTLTGLDDEKLNEKCRTKWIEKGLPIARISLARNQISISVDSILRSTFDPGVKRFITALS